MKSIVSFFKNKSDPVGEFEICLSPIGFPAGSQTQLADKWMDGRMDGWEFLAERKTEPFKKKNSRHTWLLTTSKACFNIQTWC